MQPTATEVVHTLEKLAAESHPCNFFYWFALSMIQFCKYLVGLTVIPIKTFLYILTLPIIECSYVIAIAREFEKCTLQPQSLVHNYYPCIVSKDKCQLQTIHPTAYHIKSAQWCHFILWRNENDVIMQHLVLLIACTCNKIWINSEWINIAGYRVSVKSFQIFICVSSTCR